MRNFKISIIKTTVLALIICSSLIALSCVEFFKGATVHVDNYSSQTITVKVTDKSDVIMYDNVVIEDGTYRDFLFDKAGSYTFYIDNTVSETIRKISLKDNEVVQIYFMKFD